MTPNTFIDRLTAHERLNFLLTNRIPRRWATLAMARVSRCENPLVRRVGLALWQTFGGDLELHEAKQQQFKSIHECFIRELRDGARPIDPDPGVIVSPCDGVVGAHGPIDGTQVFQAKGYPYRLEELLPDPELVERYRDGVFVTLRLRSTFYHRFHAPYDCRVSRVLYVSGDTWNVNPIALRRIERLYCKNERVVLEAQLGDGRSLALVAVAAILVASVRLSFLAEPLDLVYRGPNRIDCDAAFRKGEEIGYFQHGSTIIVLAPRGFSLSSSIQEGLIVKMGTALLQVH